MDESCAECGFGYGSVDRGTAAARIRAEAQACATLLRSADRQLATERRTPGGWSAIDYAGHLRDVLITQRERVLSARARSSSAVLPMNRDLRVEWGEYEHTTPEQLSGEIGLTAEWLAHSLELLAPSDWSATVIYNYPEPQERSLEWLSAHTVHELVHHGRDIGDLITG